MSLFGPDTTKLPIAPKLGIIGGSGMCSFPELKIISKVKIDTKYGSPSDEISICEYGEETIAFLPRHGSKHTHAPHTVPYKANLSALKQIGVEYVIGTCIVGSLQKKMLPGNLVLFDQFVNLTWGRDDHSKHDKGAFIHLPMGEPYCVHLRQNMITVAERVGIQLTPTGTVAVIQGPRFSTKAESQWLSANGWDVVNMTQYPECYFARELGLCYIAIGSITDYDVGLQESLVINPNKMEKVLEVFRGGVQNTRSLLLHFIKNSSAKLACKCANITIEAYYAAGL